MIDGANTTVSVYKLTHNTSTSTFAGTAAVTGLEAYIESQQAEMMQALDQGHNIEVFTMLCEPANISVGDKIIDASSVEYRVIGVEKHENNTDTDDLYKVLLHKQIA